MASPVLGTAFVSIEARTDKFLTSAQRGVSSAVSKLGGQVSKPLVDATGKAGEQAGKAFGKGLGNLAVPAALLLAGREITHFVLHGVQDLVQLEKEVERFSTVAGVSADTASRFVGVATDFGVAANKVSLSVGFLGKTLGKNETALDSFGVALARNSKGDIDLAKTAFNVIDAYEHMDSTTRKAALGVTAFGRGYQALIPLLNVGSEEIQKAFAEVSGGELFNQEKLDQAKSLGVAMVQIHKSVLDLQLTLAQGLAPAIEKLSKGMHASAVGVRAADSATGGAVGTLAKFGAGAAATAVTIALLRSAVTHVGHALGGLSSSTGLATKGILGIGIAIAAADIANKLTEDAHKATEALAGLTSGLDALGKVSVFGPDQSAASLTLLVRRSQELEQSKGGVKKFFDVWHSTGVDFKQVVDNEQLHLLALKETIDKVIKTDPGAVPVLRASLLQYAQAADAGDTASRDFLDSLGLTNDEIDKLVTKLNEAAVAHAKQAEAAGEGADALDKETDNLHRLTSAIPFNNQVRLNMIDIAAKQKEAEAAMAAETDKAIQKYQDERDALDELRQAKIDLVDLTLSEKQAHFDATQAVADYQKALHGVPATIEEIAAANKDAADAQKTLSDARVEFQRLLLEHPAIITPQFVLQKQAASDAITAAQAAVDQAKAHVDEVKKGKVSTPEEIEAAFLNAQRAINDEAKAAAAAKEGLLKSLGKPFTLEDETTALIANLQLQENAFGRNSPLGRSIQETVDQLDEVAKAQLKIEPTLTFISGNAAGPRFTPHVAGGKFKKGEAIKVGEDGWELLVPDFSGTVLSHDQSVAVTVGASMSRSSAPALAPVAPRSADNRPLTGPVTIIESPDGRRTYSELVRAFRASQFLSGAN